MRTVGASTMVLVTVVLMAGTAACAVAQSVPTPSAPTRSVLAPSLPVRSPSTPSLPGSVAPDETATVALTEFSGHITCGPPIRARVSAQTGDHQEFRGGAWTPTATSMSDPRLDGDYTISENSNVFSAPGPGTYQLFSGTWRIETKEGAWHGSYTVVGFPDGYVTTVTTPLVGEGDYDGLFAVWEAQYLGDAACAWDVRGVIVPGEPPAPPSAP
jgi:hypothetical protein